MLELFGEMRWRASEQPIKGVIGPVVPAGSRIRRASSEWSDRCARVRYARGDTKQTGDDEDQYKTDREFSTHFLIS